MTYDDGYGNGSESKATLITCSDAQRVHGYSAMTASLSGASR
jgi:hypothetical protein